MIISIGTQSFEKIREKDVFYIDKTALIKEWWETRDDVTLITRPRRFGKTLNMNMIECFFSTEYAGRADLFDGLAIWQEEQYRRLQGTYPVIFMSFASVKTGKLVDIKTVIKQMVSNLYEKYRFIMTSELFSDNERNSYYAVTNDMADGVLYSAVSQLCIYMERYFGKKVIILLDEYDTPMQEAWLEGTWDETMGFFRNFFNDVFKTNPNLERGIITGITRISKESIFSDLNHLEVVTTTSDKYADCFGFTEREVFDSLDAVGLGAEKEKVKHWYDGFTFGEHSDIYNPWSILKFIDSGAKYKAYWSDTSGNGLVNSLIREGDTEIKKAMEQLLDGGTIRVELDEQIAFEQLGDSADAVWSLLLAAGYLKVVRLEDADDGEESDSWYTLALTNREVLHMFRKMIKGWFASVQTAYNDFIKAMLIDDVDSMNEFMNQVAMNCFSSFDTAKNASQADAPERFYHGFVLGLMVGLEDRFVITSNRESGFGRYDIVLTPRNPETDNAYIIEFKVFKPRQETSLEDTVANALAQIEQKHYDAALFAQGITADHIRKYGFAFQGKHCLIR